MFLLTVTSLSIPECLFIFASSLPRFPIIQHTSRCSVTTELYHRPRPGAGPQQLRFWNIYSQAQCILGSR